jgi:hypothetical protein
MLAEHFGNGNLEGLLHFLWTQALVNEQFVFERQTLTFEG